MKKSTIGWYFAVKDQLETELYSNIKSLNSTVKSFVENYCEKPENAILELPDWIRDWYFRGYHAAFCLPCSSHIVKGNSELIEYKEVLDEDSITVSTEIILNFSKFKDDYLADTLIKLEERKKSELERAERQKRNISKEYGEYLRLKAKFGSLDKEDI